MHYQPQNPESAGTDSGARALGREARVLAAYVLVPALAWVLWSNFVIGGPRLAQWLDRHQARPGTISAVTNAERQLLHIEARRYRPAGAPIVSFIGSSSVVNGVDPLAIDSAMTSAGLPHRAVNDGQSGLWAYELLMSRRQLLRSDVSVYVYLYNTFSFGREYQPSAVTVRFHHAEFAKLFCCDRLRDGAIQDFSQGVLGQALFPVRYRNVIKDALVRGSLGTLEPGSWPYEYPTSEPDRESWRPRQPAGPPKPSLYRTAYLQSSRDSATAGYQALGRFIDQAHARGALVIVAPVAEPEFALYTAEKQGTDVAAVDRFAAGIARAHGAAFIPRDSFAAINAQDPLFRDPVHLSARGRARYSERLATLLTPLLRGS